MAAAGHGKPLCMKCDRRDIEALRVAIGQVRAALGPISVLINNAAHDQRHAIDEVTPEYWDDRIAVNLKHQFFAAQAIYPDMAAAGGGAIVNMGSVSWMIGQGGMPCYRSEEHTSELQSLMRTSYAVFCLKKIKKQNSRTKSIHESTC